jgi:hypothetical protein
MHPFGGDIFAGHDSIRRPGYARFARAELVGRGRSYSNRDDFRQQLAGTL